MKSTPMNWLVLLLQLIIQLWTHQWVVPKMSLLPFWILSGLSCSDEVRSSIIQEGLSTNWDVWDMSQWVEAAPGYTGEIIFLIWLGNASVFPGKRWSWRGMFRHAEGISYKILKWDFVQSCRKLIIKAAPSQLIVTQATWSATTVHPERSSFTKERLIWKIKDNIAKRINT